MASETTTAAISQQHFQSNSNQPIRILPLHRGCAEVRYLADSLNTLIWGEVRGVHVASAPVGARRGPPDRCALNPRQKV